MKDIDDLLRSAGRESAGALFSKLSEDAAPVLDHLAASLEGDIPEDRKNDLAERFARLVTKLPPLAQEKWQKRMRKALGASARTVQKIVTHATKRRRSRLQSRPQGPKPPPIPTGVRGLLYRWGPQGLERVELRDVDGQTVERSEVVSSFLIRIERVAEVIDDLRNHKEFECRLLRKGDDIDSPGRPITLEAAHFGSNPRLAEALAAAGHCDLRYTMKDIDFVRLAASSFSDERGYSRVRTVRYIGYARTEEGEDLGYVTPSVVIRGGRIMDAEEALRELGIRCEFDTESYKSIKRLDLVRVSDEELRAAQKSILDDLLLLNWPHIARCLCGHAFLAPVFRRLRGLKPYALAIVGNSGLGKTTLAGYFQSLFGPSFTDLDLESWGGTPKAIELAGHIYKDALYLVDDFKLGQFTSASLKDAMRVLQNYADGAGRNRLSRSSRMMPSAYIRGMLVLTGEDLPEGETSNLARMLVLRVTPTAGDPDSADRKRRCDEARHLYAGVMARYIAWTQTKDDAYLQETAKDLLQEFRQDTAIEPVTADNKNRVLQNLALNMLGFVLWAEFAGECGVIDEAAARRMVQEHFDFLKRLFTEQVALVSGERPSLLFLREIRAMIDSEVVRITRISARPNLKGGFVIEREHRGAGPLVGYYDGGHYYFLNDALFKEVGEYRARGRIAAGEFSKRAIMNQLFEDRVIVPNPTKSGTHDEKKHRITVDGEQKYVIEIERRRLDEYVG